MVLYWSCTGSVLVPTWCTVLVLYWSCTGPVLVVSRCRLQTELEEVEQRLSPLQAEQEVEQRLWEAELSQLTEEMERVQAASREVEQRALEDGVV